MAERTGTLHSSSSGAGPGLHTLLPRSRLGPAPLRRGGCQLPSAILTAVPSSSGLSGIGGVDRDAEHPVPVRRWTNDGLISRMPLGKGRETHMRVDIVHQ